MRLLLDQVLLLALLRLLLLFDLGLSWGGRACSLELELAVADFGALFVGCSSYYLGASEDESDFDGLVFHRLEWAADVNTELAQLADVVVVNIIYIF